MDFIKIYIQPSSDIQKCIGDAKFSRYILVNDFIFNSALFNLPSI